MTPIQLDERYEQLRVRGSTLGPGAPGGDGLFVLLNQGLCAWVAFVQAPVAVEKSTPALPASPAPVSATPKTRSVIVRWCADLVLGAAGRKEAP